MAETLVSRGNHRCRHCCVWTWLFLCFIRATGPRHEAEQHSLNHESFYTCILCNRRPRPHSCRLQYLQHVPLQ